MEILYIHKDLIIPRYKNSPNAQEEKDSIKQLLQERT